MVCLGYYIPIHTFHIGVYKHMHIHTQLPIPFSIFMLLSLLVMLLLLLLLVYFINRRARLKWNILHGWPAISVNNITYFFLFSFNRKSKMVFPCQKPNTQYYVPVHIMAYWTFYTCVCASFSVLCVIYGM